MEEARRLGTATEYSFLRFEPLILGELLTKMVTVVLVIPSHQHNQNDVSERMGTNCQFVKSPRLHRHPINTNVNSSLGMQLLVVLLVLIEHLFFLTI